MTTVAETKYEAVQVYRRDGRVEVDYWPPFAEIADELVPDASGRIVWDEDSKTISIYADNSFAVYRSHMWVWELRRYRCHLLTKAFN